MCCGHHARCWGSLKWHDLVGLASERQTFKLLKCLLQSCCNEIFCKAENLLHCLISSPIGSQGSSSKLQCLLCAFQKRPNSGAGGIWFLFNKKENHLPILHLLCTLLLTRKPIIQIRKFQKPEFHEVMFYGCFQVSSSPKRCALQQNWSPNYTFFLPCAFSGISWMHIYH